MEERKVNSSLKKCSLIMDERKKLSVFGVSDVDSFDEKNIILITDMGTLIVKGDDFHINKLNVETGEIVIDGIIDSCQFDDGYASKAQGGFWTKMFK